MSRVVDGKIIPENSVKEDMMLFISKQCGLCGHCSHVRKAREDVCVE